jgi:hypothetical protein
MTEYLQPTGPPIPADPNRPPPAPAATNTMAVLALVFAFVFSPLGIVFGVLGRKQIRRSGEGGRALATTGLVLGIVFTAVGVLTFVLVIVLAATVTPSLSKLAVGQQISDQLAPQLGHRPDSVSCLQDLPSKVGASVGCTFTDTGQTYPLTATVTSIDGNVTHFDIKSAATPVPPG